MPRQRTSSLELKKRREALATKTKNRVTAGSKNVRGSGAKNNAGSTTSTTSTTSTKGKTKAQLMALRNKKKYGGTAKAAAANKEAMRLKIKKKYLASKKKK